MRRNLFLGLLLGSSFALPLFAQDQQEQPSLADIARQNQKAKEERAKSGAPKAKSFTDENMQTGGAGKLDFGQVVTSDSSQAEKMAQAREKLAQAEQTLNTLEPLDRSTLAMAALQGQTADFPGRQAWEERLFAAKEYYVAHCREMIRNASGMLRDMEALKAEGPINRSDPRVTALVKRALDIAKDGKETDARFEAVMKEGLELAKQASH